MEILSQHCPLLEILCHAPTWFELLLGFLEKPLAQNLLETLEGEQMSPRPTGSSVDLRDRLSQASSTENQV